MKSLLIIILGIFLSCSSNPRTDKPHNTKKYKIKLLDYESDYTKIKTHTIELPNGARKLEIYPHNDRIFKEYQFHFPNNAIFYVSNDIINGSQLNKSNLIDVGIQGYQKQDLLDTISNSGLMNVDKYWKEQIIGDLVCGYINANSEYKLIFEESNPLKFVTN